MAERTANPRQEPLREFQLDVGHWLEVPEEHPTLYANWVQVMGTSTETFIDFFLVDAHPKGEAVETKKHFLARVIVNDGTRKALLDLLTATAESSGHHASQ